jgi:hypothetical protein
MNTGTTPNTNTGTQPNISTGTPTNPNMGWQPSINAGTTPTTNTGRQPDMTAETPPGTNTNWQQTGDIGVQPTAETDTIPTTEANEALTLEANSTTVAERKSETPQSSCSESQSQDSENVRKIQRSDLSILPRKYWNIANNSFLMHGYHNYHHLMLVESNGHYWLGVPGVYSPREARAAELFGFPQFTKSHVERLTLSDDEKDDSEDFGHWCRYMM